MIVRKVPAELYTVTADDGAPLMIYGTNKEGIVMLWPTPHIRTHRIAFARFCKRHVAELRGQRFLLQHRLSPETCRWAEWLGVQFEAGVAII